MESRFVTQQSVHWLCYGAPDMNVFLHHVYKDVRLNTHSLVHLYATSIRVEADGVPWHIFDSARAASTVAMLADWNILLQDVKYTGHNFLCLHFEGNPVTVRHTKTTRLQS